MCTIDSVIKGVAAVAAIAIPAVKSYNDQKNTLNYRTTLAINNMKEAKKESYTQKQLGIEEARKQKITGLRVANELMAANASSGFAADSGNNLLNYEDSVYTSYQDALDSQNAYNVRADNYFEKAREYLNDAKEYQRQKKKVGWFTALGSSKQVASKWFKSVN